MSVAYLVAMGLQHQERLEEGSPRLIWDPRSFGLSWLLHSLLSSTLLAWLSPVLSYWEQGLGRCAAVKLPLEVPVSLYGTQQITLLHWCVLPWRTLGLFKLDTSLIVPNSVRGCFLSSHSLRTNWWTMGEGAGSWSPVPVCIHEMCWHAALSSVWKKAKNMRGSCTPNLFFVVWFCCGIVVPSTFEGLPGMAVPALCEGRGPAGRFVNCFTF